MHKQTKQKLAEWSGLEADKRVDNRESYPGSPSAGKGILEKYQELIEKSLTHVKNPHVLILGSTPETREIILKAGNKLITIDVSQEMIDKTNQLIKTKRDKEEIVIADWLEMPLDDNQFDLIIGDGVYNNITLNNYNKFSLEVARVSKSSAKVIFREAAINPRRPIKRIEDLIKYHRDKQEHWFELFFDILFYSTEKEKWYQKKKMENRLAKMYQQIEKYFKQGIINRKEYNDLNNLKSEIVHTFITIPDFEKHLKEYFDLLPTKQAADYRFTQDSMIFFYGEVNK